MVVCRDYILYAVGVLVFGECRWRCFGILVRADIGCPTGSPQAIPMCRINNFRTQLARFLLNSVPKRSYYLGIRIRKAVKHDV